MGSEEIIGQLYSLVSPALNERTRRLFAAAGARVLGRGGISAVAAACGVERHTVASGLADLRDLDGSSDRSDVDFRGIRRAGGGRKRLADNDAGLVDDLLAIVSPATRGDPESPLLWTCKSTSVLADELGRRGHKISPRSVAGLLRGMGYSLQANAKVIEGGQHPDRNAQFEHVNASVQTQIAAGLPAISVDTKKKELVGQFKNAGSEWRPKGAPERVKVHDFVDAEQGRAAPYGIYDIAHDLGWVNVGVDHDTAAFAVESIRQWWYAMGQPMYPNADSLLITADGGGSNGSRIRLWKVELQKFSDETGLTISVCHFPPGTSKWNKIEHRLFSFITMNWRGRPLINYEAIVSLIGSTKTRSGLRVASRLDTNKYPAGSKVTDMEMATLNLSRDTFHGEWNYSVSPRSP